MTGQTVIPAREGRAFHLESGDRIRIGLADGPQVADVFAFALPDLTELLSAEHTRSSGRAAPSSAYWSYRVQLLPIATCHLCAQYE